jgi:catechol 2,3-dioxygenase-like lactoylglutathione lyase family enzyme
LATGIFAGIPVNDFSAALEWYRRLLGTEPSFYPNDAEAVWQLAQDRFVYIIEDDMRAGGAVSMIWFDDPVGTVAAIGRRGLEPLGIEKHDPVWKYVFHDPDGNEIGVGGRVTGAAAALRTATVIRVREDACQLIIGGAPEWVPFSAAFPSPRTERVSPGNLVAVGTAPDGALTVMWRWYDAVVLGAEADLIRMWEPAHGEVLARSRSPLARPPGSRAYLSAGLPGAQWWVAGPVSASGDSADVELDAVQRFLTDNGVLDRPR